MDSYALSLVLIAALLHATWNLAAKKSGGTTVFAFCTGLATVLIWAPLVLAYKELANLDLDFNNAQNKNIIISGIIHAIYYVILLKGYKSAPLSIVYPVARGTGPLISAFIALWLFDENFTIQSFSGIILIVIGIFALTWSGQSILKLDKTFLKGIYWGLATGLSISTYTLFDAYGVKTLKIDAVIYDYLTGLVRTVVLIPFVLNRGTEIKLAFKYQYRPIIIISILGSLAYILVLSAMKIAPVSHIAPAREISMMFGAFLGGKVLKEGHIKKRVFAASLIAFGVILLAFAK